MGSQGDMQGEGDAPLDPNLKALIDRFPRLLHDRQFLDRSDLSPGWVPLVSSALEEVDALLKDEEARFFRLRQVKEKWGELRVYFALGEDEDLHLDGIAPTGRVHEVFKSRNELVARIRAVFDRACEASSRTCELCGRPGELRKGGYLRTLCEEHSRQHDEEHTPLE